MSNHYRETPHPGNKKLFVAETTKELKCEIDLIGYAPDLIQQKLKQFSKNINTRNTVPGVNKSAREIGLVSSVHQFGTDTIRDLKCLFVSR